MNIVKIQTTDGGFIKGRVIQSIDNSEFDKLVELDMVYENSMIINCDEKDFYCYPVSSHRVITDIDLNKNKVYVWVNNKYIK